MTESGVPAQWALFEHAPDAMIVVDSAGRVIFANGQAERVFGYARAELIGSPLETLLPARYRRSHGEFVAKLFSAPGHRAMGSDLELVGLRRDGREFPAEIALSPIASAGGPLVVAAIRDMSARKRAEELHRVSMAEAAEARLQLDCAPACIALLDAHGIITHVNETWRRFGRENGAQEATWVGVGQDYLEACRHTTDGSAVLEGIGELLAGRRRSFDHVYRCHSDSHLRWFRLQARRPEGNHAGVVLLHVDVSDHYLAEQRLSVQSGLATALAQGQSVVEAAWVLARLIGERLAWDCAAIWRLNEDASLRCLDVWCRAGLELSGFERATRASTLAPACGFPGRTEATRESQWLADLDRDLDDPRAEAARAAGLKSGFCFPIMFGELTLVVELYGRVRRELDAPLLGLVATAKNQLEELGRRIRAEEQAQTAAEALRTKSRQLSAVLACAPAFILATDKAGIVQFVNHPLPHRRREEIVGSSWLEHVPVCERERVEVIFRDVLSTSAPRTFDLSVPNADGTLRFLANYLSPMRSDEEGGGEALGVVLVSQDVTETKSAQAELAVAQRLASVGMLAAGVAHEINNPLAYVIANHDFVARELPEVMRDAEGVLAPRATEVLEVLAEAREGAERIRRVVRDLKTFSRTEHDRRARVQVREVIEVAIGMAWNEIRHRARLTKDYGKTPAVLTDESRLGQVILNLLVNAAQAIPVGQVESQEIRLRTSCDGRRVMIEVSDTGSGIAAADLPRIFDPFFTTKLAGQGTGLGLAICSSIMKELGGGIGVTSEPGKGSVFRVWLPAAEGDAIPRPAEAPEPTARASRRARILIVDDEVAVGRSLGRLLSSEHEVVVTVSGKDALALLSAGERFDLILCDLMMPQMSGMEFYAEVARAQEAFVSRIAFMTGGVFTTPAGEFLARVPNKRIEKPFDQHSLRALVSSVLADE